MVGTFKDLIIWQKGLELSMKVRKLTSRYPIDERFGLVEQTNRSSNSVIANIAESSGRYHYSDKIRVLYISRGECFETQSHLSVAYNLGYLEKSDYDLLDIEYQGLAKGINSYILSIRKSKSTN
ncbi:four helix bundle protein [Candidatus Woesebacteria bacterium]|nr:MAG: four helix bundle protein [Candidatus Woesebacteria bacterium]